MLNSKTISNYIIIELNVHHLKMKNNNYLQLTKEESYSSKNTSRQLSKMKRKSTTIIIISIVLILIILFIIIINVYISSLLFIAQHIDTEKAVQLNNLVEELEMKDKELFNRKGDKDDIQISVMLAQISRINNDKILRGNKNQREKLLKKYKEIMQQKINSNLNTNSKSLIITTTQKEKLEEWTSGSFGVLCFRKTRDGLKPEIFHKNCDEYQSTITIIATKNEQIIGGFTSRKWEGNVYKYDIKAFLFSFNKKKIYRIDSDFTAIHANPKHLPSFGVTDLIITETESTIAKRLESYSGDSTEYEINKGEPNLDIKEMEVFEIRSK